MLYHILKDQWYHPNPFKSKSIQEKLKEYDLERRKCFFHSFKKIYAIKVYFFISVCLLWLPSVMKMTFTVQMNWFVFDLSKKRIDIKN